MQDRVPHRREPGQADPRARGWRTPADDRHHLRVAALRPVRRWAANRDPSGAGGNRCGSTPGRLIGCAGRIEGTGVGPENFVWPPAEDLQRAPYRGWEPFEDIDAGVFFGRDVAIVRGLDELRAHATVRRSSHCSSCSGPSGSGKSSFLRAGLIPRLQREDRRFLVLGVMRPERQRAYRGAGLAAAIHAAAKDAETGRRAVGRGQGRLPARRRPICGVAGRDARHRGAATCRAGPGRDRRPRWCCRWTRPRNCSPPTPDRRPSSSSTLLADLVGRLNADGRRA